MAADNRPNEYDIRQLIRDTSRYIILWPIIAYLGCHLSYAAAALNFPIHDDFFLSFDRLLGFDWLQAYRFIQSYPLLHQIFDFFYLSINWQAPLAVVILATLRRERLPELMIQFVIGLVLSILVYALLPSLGPAYDYGIMGNDNAAALLLRSGGYPSTVAGIVPFPSMHTAMVIFYTYSQRQLPTFLPIAVLNALMLVTVPTSGDHYLIDIVAGALLAGFVILCQKRFFGAAARKTCAVCFSNIRKRLCRNLSVIFKRAEKVHG